MVKNAGNQPMRWKRKDYLTVEKAIQDFNTKIKKLQKEEAKPYLPEELKLSDVRETIVSRSELKRFLASLRDFKAKGAEKKVILEGGEEITDWEQKQLQKQRKIMQARLKQEMAELNVPLESGFSRAQMGSFKFAELQAKMNQILGLEKKKGQAFERAKKAILGQGRLDYNLRKAKIFKQNYMDVLTRYKSYDNYNKLIRKIESMSYARFWEFVKANESDLLADLTYQSEEFYSQEEFNFFVENWGIESESDSVSM